MDRREELKRELMVTFQAELADHLSTLDQGLLALEAGPGDGEERLHADLFRAAHSLKGAARAVELRDIEAIAHRMEDLLGAAHRGEVPAVPALFDLLFQAVDALREAMDAHLQGSSLPAEAHHQLLTRLKTASRGDPLPTAGRTSDKLPSSAGANPLTPGPRPAPHEETVRVATEKLDRLMDGMGELLVAGMRAEQRLIELQDLKQQLTNWEKEWRLARSHYHRVLRKRRANRSPDDGSPVREMLPVMDYLATQDNHLKLLRTNVRGLLRRFAADRSQLKLLSDELQENVRRARMVPIAALFDPLPRMVRDLARERGKEVAVHIEGAETEVDRLVLEAMRDPLIHLLRNAVDHGIELPEQREREDKARRGTVRVRALQKGHSIVLEVTDDGAGIDLDAVRRAAVRIGLLAPQEAAKLSAPNTLLLIFHSGLSTQDQVTDLSGRGIGLDVVRQNLERLHGVSQVETRPGQGTSFTLTLPLTLTTSQVLLVGVAGLTVAIPTTTVERILRVNAGEVGQIEGKPAITSHGRPLPLIPLRHLLALPASDSPRPSESSFPVVMLGVAEQRVALRVDRLEGTQEVVVKSLGRQLRRVRNIAGATILGNGQVIMILNVADLIRSAQDTPSTVAPLPLDDRAPPSRRVLVVDDSITTRTLEKNILENSGYRVLVATDGEEAWSLMQTEALDLVVSDIAMPRMDGFALTERIRDDERFRDLPVILVTSLESQQDRRRGLEVGADAYITKSTFDQQNLLDAMERLIG